MSRQFYNLPPLNALATFEAVARHQNISQAAAELGVTPGAVSRQVKILEAEIGIELLLREHKKIHCNKHGTVLFETLKTSFSGLNKTISKFAEPADEHSFSLGSTTAFSSLWLMPRLSQFWKQHPHIRINHVLTDNTLELANTTVDISIRYDFEDLSNEHARVLFKDKFIRSAARNWHINL